MSKIKSPQQKKRLSLKHDRRNTYGENSKSSRKNIARAKRRSHKLERKALSEPLQSLTGQFDEARTTEAELLAVSRFSRAKRKAFKKNPDTPLGAVIKHKKSKDLDYRLPPRGMTSKEIFLPYKRPYST